MTQYSLRNKGVVLFFYVLIMMLGISAIKQLPKQEFPEFPSWSAVIITQMQGASPLKIEELVTEKIEQKVNEVSELYEITSTSKTGVSYVFLKINESIEEVSPIWDKVREKLEDVKADLPQEATVPWLNNDFGKPKSIVIAITGDGFSNRELIEIAKDLKKDFNSINYVSKIDVIGEQKEQIVLEGSNAKFAELGISGNQIAQILADQNVLSSGGSIRVEPKSLRVQVTGEFSAVEEIRNTVISLPGSQNVIKVEDLFTVIREYIDPPTFQMRYMRQPAVGLVIEMQDDGQIIQLGNNVKQLLEEKQQEAYVGIDFHIMNFQPKWVQLKIEEFIQNLWQAVLIVAVAMMILLGWREGIIISFLIPFAFLLTLIVMLFFGIQIHQISIAALIIALGMLVDNGIVMVESISKYIQNGMEKNQAAIRASKELFIPLLTSTATTVSAFLPIALAESAVGIFVKSMTIVIGITLLASFFVAITLIPLLCMLLLKPKKQVEEQVQTESRFAKLYQQGMYVVLRFKFLSLAVVILIFFGVMQLGGQLRQVFFPPSDRAQLLVDVYMPDGTDFRDTKKKLLIAENDILQTYPEKITNMAIYLGEGGPAFTGGVVGEQANPGYAQIVINNRTFEDTLELYDELQAYFDQNFPDANAIVKQIESGPPVGAPLKIKVYGKEIDQLFAYTQEIKTILGETPGAIKIRDDWGELIPKISVVVNQEQARRVGTSTKEISNITASILNGSPVTEYREGDKSIPVVFRAVEEERNKLSSLQNLSISTSQNVPVPLLQVANLEVEWEISTIKHLNRRRTITIQGYLSGERTATEILDEVEEKLETMSFETGYGFQIGGEKEESEKANQSIMDKVPIAGALLVMVLVAQFANVRKMLVILFTIPLSFIGVIVGLLSVDFAFGFMAFLGVISLAGIVVNNGILLLEQTKMEIENGNSPFDALIHAGRRRAFPIILTTFTTISGLIPLAFSGDFWGPMAVTIMGGLLFSTLLTLIVVPVLYAILFRVKYQPSESN